MKYNGTIAAVRGWEVVELDPCNCPDCKAIGRADQVHHREAVLRGPDFQLAFIQHARQASFTDLGHD